MVQRVHVRAAIVASGVAAVTALVLTGAPALARNAARSAMATPVIIAGAKKIAIISGQAIIDT